MGRVLRKALRPGGSGISSDVGEGARVASTSPAFPYEWKPLSAAFADPRDGFAAVQGGCETGACAFELYKTGDGGTWRRVAWDPVPAPWPTARANLPLGTLSLVAAPGPGLVIVGSLASSSALYVSGDGGDQFRPELASLRSTQGAFAPGGAGWALKLRILHSRELHGDAPEQRGRRSDLAGGASPRPGRRPQVAVAYDGTRWLTRTFPTQVDCDPCTGAVSPLPAAGRTLRTSLPQGAAPLAVDPVTAHIALVLGWLHGSYVI